MFHLREKTKESIREVCRLLLIAVLSLVAAAGFLYALMYTLRDRLNA